MSGPYEYPQDPNQYPPAYPGPQQDYPPAGPPDVLQRGRLAQRLADRVAERPAPRLGISLAGVGVGLAILGVVIWGVAYIAEGSSNFFSGEGAGTPGGSRHYLGAGIALVVVIVGYVLAITAQHGPLATAGIAASAIGVPVTLEFLTFDLHEGSTQVINFDAVTWGSVAVWVISYLFVRGARGHSFYLGLTALLLWDYAVDKSTRITFQQTILGDQSSNPLTALHDDFGTLAGVSLTIGLLYYVIAWALDRTGRRGAAVALVLVGFPAVAVGIAALVPNLKQVGTGLVLVVVGVLLSGYGARFGHRFTTWVWAVGAAGGAALVVAKLVADAGAVQLGISFIALGAVFVAGGALIARLLHEPDDVLPAAERPEPVAGATAG
jgi:hypothetical protein